jgi:drug/metabolite transporter (DMT)-like permease
LTTTKDYIQLHFLVFLFGFTAVLGKLVSIPSVEMVFYRTLLAAIGMMIVMILMRKSFYISRGKDLVKLFLTGLIVAIHWLTFFASGRVSNPSVSLIGFATCSFWAAIIEPIAKRKKIRPMEVGLGIAVLMGLYLIFSFNFEYPLGLFLGILSGLTAALFSTINSKIVNRVNEFAITFYEMVGACVSVSLFFIIYQKYFTNEPLQLIPLPADWFYIGLMAIACSVYAYSAMIQLSKKISVFFIQLALNLEPLYGITLAILVFGQKEILSWNFYAGTLIILGAVAAYPLLKRRYESHFNSPSQ